MDAMLFTEPKFIEPRFIETKESEIHTQNMHFAVVSRRPRRADKTREGLEIRSSLFNVFKKYV